MTTHDSSVCLINYLKSFGVIWDHLESFKSWSDKISYTIKMQRCSKMHCPFPVSQYYRCRSIFPSSFTKKFPKAIFAAFGMKQKKCNIFCVVTHNHLFTPTFAAIFTRKSFSCENGQVEQHNALWCDKASFEISSPSQEQKMVCTD